MKVSNNIKENGVSICHKRPKQYVNCYLQCHSHEDQKVKHPGLYKLFHPAILDGRTWSKLGEHGDHGEHGKDGKHQLDDLKHPIYDSKHSICKPDDSEHSILRL